MTSTNNDDMPLELTFPCVNYSTCIATTSKGIQCSKLPVNGKNYCSIHKQYTKPDTCPICIESIEEEKKPLSCGHWVHKNCLLQWKAECPICRLPVKLTKKEKSKLPINISSNDYLSEIEIDRIIREHIMLHHIDISTIDDIGLLEELIFRNVPLIFL
jgi:hypothetical protein